ncbi:MAG TPA: SUMF1/EgtB/PvdO family nonheme iron enzyme [Candidatus Acidoferrales bacterium]|nr:SUMF1/EgtB/PvdO family nonheme iron enzyme [Candidatus Acidoferrales bacterium]
MGTSVAAARIPHLLQRLAAARARTDELIAIVRPEALYDRPIPERHRIIFYLGHLEAFDWNLLGRQYFDLRTVDETFNQLFAFGIDPMGSGLPTDLPQDWPARSKVDAYNRNLRQTLDERLAATFDSRRELTPEIEQLVEAAIEHRLMHAETLAYLLHQLPLSSKFLRADQRAPLLAPAKPYNVKIPAGTATLGMRRIGDDSANSRAPMRSFGWDNEFEEHQVRVPEFQIDAYKVTNGEFLSFYLAGGYQDRSLWRDEDWDWLQSKGISHPHFWAFHGNKPFLRTMFEEAPLPMDWPVYVSHAEASAYARWASKELPSEAEWYRAAHGTPASSKKPDGIQRAFPWGDQLPTADHGNFDFQRWDPVSVAAFPAGASAFGAHGILGNGWEWTRTIFAPFAGFRAFPFYPGYSADFFDDKHYVLKGGSPRTAACILRRSFRNWFQPHYPYIYAGFRCIERSSGSGLIQGA